MWVSVPEALEILSNRYRDGGRDRVLRLSIFQLTSDKLQWRPR